MKKKQLLVGSVAAVALVASFAAGFAVARHIRARLTSFSQAHVDAHHEEGAASAASRFIEGDGMKGAYMGFLKLPAGFESPPHSHTNEYWSVLVRGDDQAADGGEEEDSKAIGPGGVTHMPAKVAHVSKCAAEPEFA